MTRFQTIGLILGPALALFILIFPSDLGISARMALAFTAPHRYFLDL